MADVFISYKREDHAAVQRLVRELRRAGLSVWWDQDIAADAAWERTVERELDAAKVVIVAWSPASVESDNVKAEARQARQEGKLIQVFIAPCEPPLFFGERQGVQLEGWRGRAGDHRFQALVGAVRAVLAGRAPSGGVGFTHPRRRTWQAVASGLVIVSAAVGLLVNIGAIRDLACALPAAKAMCQPAVSSTPTPAVADTVVTQARSRLIRQVDGSWDRQDRSCRTPITITASVGSDGVDRIDVSGPKGYESTGEVVAADNGVVVSRNSTPTPGGGPREQWEYRPKGDELVVMDKDGVATTLVRCPAKS